MDENVPNAINVNEDTIEQIKEILGEEASTIEFENFYESFKNYYFVWGGYTDSSGHTSRWAFVPFWMLQVEFEPFDNMLNLRSPITLVRK